MPKLVSKDATVPEELSCIEEDVLSREIAPAHTMEGVTTQGKPSNRNVTLGKTARELSVWDVMGISWSQLVTIIAISAYARPAVGNAAASCVRPDAPPGEIRITSLSTEGSSTSWEGGHNLVTAGHAFTSFNRCVYTLVEGENFSVEGDNVICGATWVI